MNDLIEEYSGYEEFGSIVTFYDAKLKIDIMTDNFNFKKGQIVSVLSIDLEKNIIDFTIEDKERLTSITNTIRYSIDNFMDMIPITTFCY